MSLCTGKGLAKLNNFSQRKGRGKFCKLKLTLIKNRVNFKKQLQSLGPSADFVGRLPEAKTGKEARVQANCKIRRKPGDGKLKNVATSRSNEGVLA